MQVTDYIDTHAPQFVPPILRYDIGYGRVDRSSDPRSSDWSAEGWWWRRHNPDLAGCQECYGAGVTWDPVPGEHREEERTCPYCGGHATWAGPCDTYDEALDAMLAIEAAGC